MILTTLRLRNFRNHLDSSFEFGNGTNILLGDNGQGKTNVIEAISYLCLTKSFYAGSDAPVLNVQENLFEVDGKFHSDHGVESTARVAYDRQLGEKAVFVNHHPVEPFSAHIGRYPVVLCSPEHAPITAGSPNERRKFIDFVISQASPVYLETLMEYRRVLKQRNKLLVETKYSTHDTSALLDPWDEQMVKLGAFIMHRRMLFLDQFQTFLVAAYRKLAGIEEEPTLVYAPFQRPGGQIESEEDFRTLISEGIREKRLLEVKMGTSLIGPHRDEVALALNGMELRKFASQGQHKTFLVALKFAEFFYLKECCNEMPLLLLDDLFSELDEHRAEHLMAYVETVNQTFITSTTLHLFDRTSEFVERSTVFTIDHGRVNNRKASAVS